MADLEPGIYEVLVTEELRSRLGRLPAEHSADERGLSATEAPDRIALHLSREIARALEGVRSDDDRVEVGLQVARELLDRLGQLLEPDPSALPASPASVLHAIGRRRPDGRAEHIGGPLTPLLDTTLLTNAQGEPSLWSQLLSEIESADRIDVVMAFIRQSGIGPLLGALERHVARGRALRVLTTTYTGTTERRALDLLASLGGDVRVSYDVGTTRLHAKAWVFHRRSGFSTAYVGSSNLTQTAQATGLEWNVRASEARNPDLVAKFRAVFDTYWESGDFVGYVQEEFDREHARSDGAPSGPAIVLSPIELRPYPFQERLLELIELSRQRGYSRNLVAAATGTGKTIVAAIDYARLRGRVPRARLLFVAHREEILNQSLAVFRHALRDPSFGEKWVGGARPRDFEHVFASVQSLNAADLDAMPPDHFDVVIVDEFHHAAAASYTRLLGHLRPAQLLGLTATPERSDGLPILQWFGDRIAAELRLWDAIDQQVLTPFVYYGIHDGLDLTEVPWRRGRGYDVGSLTNVFTSSDAWARLVVQEVGQHTSPSDMRCLGFCVSVAHARFMAHHFSRHGISAVAVSGESSWEERERALRDLSEGRVNAVFSVDLFNEGVDVPSVDTVLMLRPTESPTLFLQQLGRGLRRAHGKGTCTVLDFVGTHRREFRFDRRLRALLGGSRKDVQGAVEHGFPFLPAGCHMQLDRKSSEIVLGSLREALPSRWPAKVDELRTLRRDDPGLDLAGFLEHSGLDLDDVYDGNHSWSELLEAAGGAVAAAGPSERALRRAIGRNLHIDDDERIGAYLRLLDAPHSPQASRLDERERRLARMLVASVVGEAVDKHASLQAGLDLLWEHPQIRAELRQLLAVLGDRVEHVHTPLRTHSDAPLQIHARYAKIEILAAMGIGDGAKIAPWQSGVYEAKAANAELFAFTLDKSSGQFSPTTRYRDYAISPTLLHWESQSVTREDSPTGLRYRNHERDGRAILLFARLRTDERAFWFLGPARYRGHEGEKPMAITWELDQPLSGDLYSQFAAAVA